MAASLIFGGLLGALAIAFLLFIRPQDLPKPAPVSPFQHLDERKAAIYESLRDLQFEYRLNKLSDADYQATKLELQKELAHVLAETDKIKAELAARSQPAARAGVVSVSERSQPATRAGVVSVSEAGKAPQPLPVAPKQTVAKKSVCPSCGAEFEKALKFCGECGKPMGVAG